MLDVSTIKHRINLELRSLGISIPMEEMYGDALARAAGSQVGTRFRGALQPT
ncbi:MAG TPA: hypothetical protein VF745_11470 [Steroidobacteraceae bacterium]